MNRRGFIAGAAALGAATLRAPTAGGATSLSLDAAAGLKGRYFGAAVRPDQLAAEPGLMHTLLQDCGSITAEIHMKWNALQPAADVWTTGPADALADLARREGLKLRGHTLLWDQSTPRWAEQAMTRSRDWSVLGRFIRTTVGRYAGRVTEWDVVNEPIDQNGLRLNPFLRAYGQDYVVRALEEARAADPQARLFINDYGFEYDNPVEEGRRRAVLRLLVALKDRGAPLDGVGVQAHLDLAKGPLKSEILTPFLAELADLGLEIAVTELDVKEADIRLPLEERDGRVADEVRRYLDIALDQPAVRGVTTWGLSDKHSWLAQPGRAGAALNRGLPYDASLSPKPMRQALLDQLAA
jgi:endo-1,4-beta-xylanase